MVALGTMDSADLNNNVILYFLHIQTPLSLTSAINSHACGDDQLAYKVKQ